MKKMIKYLVMNQIEIGVILKIILSVLVFLIITACGEDDEDTGIETEENEAGNTVEEDETNSDSEKTLSLGEKGVMETTLGEYEVTVNSFEIIDSHDENEPTHDEFLIVDLSIENIGNSTLDGSDVASAVIFTDDEIMFERRVHLEFVDLITEEIEPGDVVSGQLLFDPFESQSYTLVFGYGLSTVSTELIWEFSRGEGK